jgi:arsenate reductase
MGSPTLVLFACVRDAGRSQMAAAWFGTLADPRKAVAESAGTEPAAEVHPEVVTAMREVGIDLAARRPRRLSDVPVRQAQWLVTMGCGAACPHVPGVRRENWELDDPARQPLERVREIRDDIRERVRGFVLRHGWSRFV